MVALAPDQEAEMAVPLLKLAVEAAVPREAPAVALAVALAPDQEVEIAVPLMKVAVDAAVPMENPALAVALPVAKDQLDPVRVAETPPVPPKVLHEMSTPVPVTTTLPLEPMLVKVTAPVLAPALADTVDILLETMV